MITPAVAWIDSKDEFSPKGAPNRWYFDRGVLCRHSLYGAPTLAMLAKGTRRQEYLSVMDSFFDDITATLLDEETGLFYRDPSFIGKRDEHGKRFCGREAKWMGVRRKIRPHSGVPARKRSTTQAIYRSTKRMAAAIIERQPSDGLWRPNLDDPTLPDNPESSGTAFFTFGLAWGIRHGLLDRATYLPPTQKAFIALVSAVSPEGKVQWGQLVDSKPNPSTKENTHETVTGAFLLAASEASGLA